MRNIPRIMSIHMSMAASYWHDGFAGDGDAMRVQHNMHDMMRGIQAYLEHPYERSINDVVSVFEDGAVRLLRVEGGDYQDGRPVLLLVPSLINKAYILDLSERRSMLRFFLDQGINAYLLDWGDLQADDGVKSIDDAAQVIVNAGVFLNEAHGARVHMLGYCMGGTLVCGAGCLRPDLFASLVCMAAPWDFHAGSQALTNRVKFWTPTLLPSLKDKGYMTADWLQILFASLDPALAVQKYMRFAEVMGVDDAGEAHADEAALFVAVEDWLNDGVCLPEGIASRTIKDWFFDNLCAEGAWEVNGQVIDPAGLGVSVFVVASSKDKLVEFECAKALADGAAGARLYDPECGHIGMIAGREAVAKVWQPIADWIFSCEKK